MRRGLQLFANRVLRSRYGIALLLSLIVLAVLGGARWLGGPPHVTALSDRASAPAITVDPTAGDDGVISPAPPSAAEPAPGTAEQMAVARAFAAAWLHHRGVTADEWYAALLPHASQDLAARLAGVDPARVPADRVVGETTLVPRGDNLVEATVPVDTGRLSLRLIAPHGRWLVDGVDWERS